MQKIFHWKPTLQIYLTCTVLDFGYKDHKTSLGYKSLLHKKEKKIKMILTDIVIFSAWTKFETQWEWCEELKLLGELQGPVGRVRPVALPALETFRRGVARTVAVVVDHIEDVAFRPLLRDRVHVVGTVYVQIIINAYVDVVVSSDEPVKRREASVSIYYMKY